MASVQECMEREVRTTLGDLLIQLLSTRAELNALKSLMQDMPMPATATAPTPTQTVNGKDHAEKEVRAQ